MRCLQNSDCFTECLCSNRCTFVSVTDRCDVDPADDLALRQYREMKRRFGDIVARRLPMVGQMVAMSTVDNDLY